jgi:hypothetical protein
MNVRRFFNGPMFFFDVRENRSNSPRQRLSGKRVQNQRKMPMKRKLFLFSYIALAIAVCGAMPRICAQTQQPAVTAVVEFSGGQSLTVLDLSDDVGLQPNEAVGIIVQLSTDEAGQALTIECLDGGSVIGGKSSAVVGDDGTLRFGFKAGGSSGRYQVVLRNDAQEIGLRFWVFDVANPQNNPPVLTPSNP